METLMQPSPLPGDEGSSGCLAETRHRAGCFDIQTPFQPGAVQLDGMDTGLVSLLFDD